jgi:hypothetical protein
LVILEELDIWTQLTRKRINGNLLPTSSSFIGTMPPDQRHMVPQAQIADGTACRSVDFIGWMWMLYWRRRSVKLRTAFWQF